LDWKSRVTENHKNLWIEWHDLTLKGCTQNFVLLLRCKRIAHVCSIIKGLSLVSKLSPLDLYRYVNIFDAKRWRIPFETALRCIIPCMIIFGSLGSTQEWHTFSSRHTQWVECTVYALLSWTEQELIVYSVILSVNWMYTQFRCAGCATLENTLRTEYNWMPECECTNTFYPRLVLGVLFL